MTNRTVDSKKPFYSIFAIILISDKNQYSYNLFSQFRYLAVSARFRYSQSVQPSPQYQCVMAKMERYHVMHKLQTQYQLASLTTLKHKTFPTYHLYISIVMVTCVYLPSKYRRPHNIVPSVRLSHKLLVKSHLLHFQPLNRLHISM